MIKINKIEISSRKLIEGKVYADIDEDTPLIKPTLLRFVKYDEVGDPLFEHVGGHNPYYVHNGFIEFPADGSGWYEVENFEEQN